MHFNSLNSALSQIISCKALCDSCQYEQTFLARCLLQLMADCHLLQVTQELNHLSWKATV